MIKIDMEMPESCTRCFAEFCNTCRILTAIEGKAVKIEGHVLTRKKHCPLIDAKTADDNKKLKYERLQEEMAGWPDWKKKAYNEMFATSTHSEKLEVKE